MEIPVCRQSPAWVSLLARVRTMGWVLAAGCFLTACPGPAMAMENPNVPEMNPWFSTRVWQAEDGLPENRVVGVAQAEDGYLWVATQVGMVRFDGAVFSSLTVPEYPHLFSGTLRLLIKDRTGTLWLAKEGGVIVRIRGRQVRVFTPADGLPPNETQRSVVVDGSGALWVAYAGGRVVRWQDGKVQELGNAELLPSAGVAGLAVSEDGTLWWAKDGAAGDFKDGKFRKLMETGPGVVQIAAARGGGIWICTGQELM